VNKRTLDDKSKAVKGSQNRNIYFGRWSGDGVVGCGFFKKLETWNAELATKPRREERERLRRRVQLDRGKVDGVLRYSQT
jgi:hypothetical protein